MTTQFDCALNGILLSSVDDRICVLDIQENAPKLRTTSLALHPEGQHMLRQTRDSLTVQVRFAIHEEDPLRRREAAQAVHTWAAKGGLLTTSDRSGQQLTVICTGYPAVAAGDWTQELTLTFQSARVPYWEDAETTSVSGSSVLTLTTPGTAESAPVDVVVVNNTAQTITHLKVRCGSTEMNFEGINFPANTMFVLNQTDGPLSARVMGSSILHCRTAESADLLLAPCGQSCTVYASADAPLQSSFTVRGRYV